MRGQTLQRQPAGEKLEFSKEKEENNDHKTEKK
jgi:hypothetical protein